MHDAALRYLASWGPAYASYLRRMWCIIKANRDPMDDTVDRLRPLSVAEPGQLSCRS